MVMLAPTKAPRQMPVAEQRRRTAELDRIRLQRRLTAEEQAEAFSLTNRAYLREWRCGLATPKSHGGAA